MAVERTIVEQEGDTFERSLQLTDDSGNAIDITGWTFVFSVKEERSDSDTNAIIRKEVTSHTNATNGETEITLTSTETEGLFGDYWYDLKFKTDTGTVDSILAGVFRIEDSITNDI